MLDQITKLGNRYGWGVMVSAAPFVNAVVMITGGLACFLLVVFFSLFGVSPAPPSETGNIIAWALWLLMWTCFGWFYWSMFLFYFLVPLGLAWSIADLVQARNSGNKDKASGATAGITLTLIPLILYFRAIGHPGSECLNGIAEMRNTFRSI